MRCTSIVRSLQLINYCIYFSDNLYSLYLPFPQSFTQEHSTSGVPVGTKSLKDLPTCPRSYVTTVPTLTNAVFRDFGVDTCLFRTPRFPYPAPHFFWSEHEGSGERGVSLCPAQSKGRCDVPAGIIPEGQPLESSLSHGHHNWSSTGTGRTLCGLRSESSFHVAPDIINMSDPCHLGVTVSPLSSSRFKGLRQTPRWSVVCKFLIVHVRTTRLRKDVLRVLIFKTFYLI